MRNPRRSALILPVGREAKNADTYSRRSLGAATPNCGGGVAANPRILPATSPVCVLLTGQLRPARFGGRAAFSVR